MTIPDAVQGPPWSTGRNRGARRRNEILRRLREAYPGARLELRYRDPFELLAAAVLAAQTADTRVNGVTPELFARWPDAAALAGASEDDVAAVIRPVNYYRTKAGRLVALADVLVTQHEGRVPEDGARLEALPGVGRKTATLVLNHGFGQSAGIVVDTHVRRISGRLDWSHASEPERMADELEALIPRDAWRTLQNLLAAHGRACCRATRPVCGACPVGARCYWPDKEGG